MNRNDEGKVMSEQNNGGPAFPEHGQDAYGMARAEGGMSLRDYFAAKAMQGLIASAEGQVKPESYVLAAFRIADAMLAERTK